MATSGVVVIPGEGNNVAQRTCSIEECERKHIARGLCAMHWKQAYGQRTRYEITCASCGTTHMSARRDGKFCSDECKGAYYSEAMLTKCPLPEDHPVMVLIQAEREARAAEAREAEDHANEQRRELSRERRATWGAGRECPGCGCTFCPLYTSTTICCSHSCAKRMARRRRRAREHDASGSWRWSDFMRIARKFNYCCAYCGITPERLDPDHVVPLSRGGYDSPSNLLPTCNLCNSSKGAMTLDEWATWLADHEREPRATNWATEDRRYHHLTQSLLALTSPAA